MTISRGFTEGMMAKSAEDHDHYGLSAQKVISHRKIVVIEGNMEVT